MPRPRRRGERGAVAVFTAVAMALLIAVAAFGVDLGMQRVVRRDMQAVADAVAFDLARQVDGRTAATILASPSWAAALAQTTQRNAGSSLGSTPSITPELGTIDSAYAFTPASGTVVPTAVRVTASASVDFNFTSGSGSAERSAVAVARAQACYKLGSWGARLSTASNANIVYQVLSEHGIGAAVDLVTYQSLAGAHVDLAALSAALGLASPESLATTTVSLSALLDAAATVVGSNGSTGAQVSALNLVKANLGALATETFTLANLASVGAGAGSGLSGAVNLADLVIGSILVADGNSAVDVPAIAAGIDGLTDVSVSLNLIQTAKTACGFAGSTPNSSNQVTLSLSAQLDDGLSMATSLISGVLNDLAGVEISSPANRPVTLTVSSSVATSTLDAVTCLSSSRSVAVGTSGGLLSATLTVPVSVKINLLFGLVPITIMGDIVAKLTPEGVATTVTISVPSQYYDTPYSNGGSALQLPAAAVDAPTISIGSLSLSEAKEVLNAVASTLVAPLLSALNSAVLGPLSDLVGLRTAGADVLLVDHPSCTTPALRG